VSIVGAIVGLVEVGKIEGATDDNAIGEALVGVDVDEEGAIVGTFVGATVKLTVLGNTDGIIEGEYDGGPVVGTIVVITVGILVGIAVDGTSVDGEAEGSDAVNGEGLGVGVEVGWLLG